MTTSSNNKEIPSTVSVANLQNCNIELQNIIERQSKELAESRLRHGELQPKLKEYEEKFAYADDKIASLSKELLSHMDAHKRLQRDLKDALALKDEQEQRLSSLEQRYINLQRECSSLADLNNRLETELAIRENSLKHGEERNRNLQSKLEAFEQKYEQLLKKSQSGATNEESSDSMMAKNTGTTSWKRGGGVLIPIFRRCFAGKCAHLR